MDRDWTDSRSRAEKPAAKPTRPVAVWLAGLGWAGKLMLSGAVIGMVALFLPLVRGETSVRIVDDVRGVFTLLSYLVAGTLSVLLFLPDGHPQQKAMAKAAVGAGASALLMASWLAVDGWKTGAYGVATNLAAALALTVGAIWKGADEGIFRRSKEKMAERGEHRRPNRHRPRA